HVLADSYCRIAGALLNFSVTKSDENPRGKQQPPYAGKPRGTRNIGTRDATTTATAWSESVVSMNEDTLSNQRRAEWIPTIRVFSLRASNATTKRMNNAQETGQASVRSHRPTLIGLPRRR